MSYRDNRLFLRSASRRPFGLIVLALAVTLIAASCGSGEPDTAATAAPDTTAAPDMTAAPDTTAAPATTAAPTTPSVTTVPGQQVDPDGKLVYGDDYASAGFILDPLEFRGQALTDAYMRLIYDTMLHEGAAGPEPGQAVAWNFPDAFTVELTLREGVVFHDGTPFNAEAVKLNWDRFIADEEVSKPPDVAAMTSVDVLGEYEIRINLSAPAAGNWLNRRLYEARSGLAIISPAVLESAGAFGEADYFITNPVGAGPYEFVEYDENQRVSVRRFDGYWDPSQQPFAEMDFVQVSQGAPRLAALLSGTVDMASITANDISSAESQGLTVLALPTNALAALEICVPDPPLDNRTARQAIGYAVNPQELIDLTQAGNGVVSNVIPLLHVTGGEGALDDLDNQYSYDPDRARELMAEAGIEPGTSITLAVGAANPNLIAQAEIVARQLEEVGFSVEITPLQGFWQAQGTERPNLYFAAGVERWQYMNNYLPNGLLNFCGWEYQPWTDAFNTSQDVTLSDEEIVAAYHDAQQALLDDVFYTGLYNFFQFHAMSPDVLINESTRTMVLQNIPIFRTIEGVAGG